MTNIIKDMVVRKEICPVLRILTTVLFMFAILLQGFQRQVVVLDYHLNTESFLAACENRARPALNCAGRCQVAKKQQEQDKQEQKNPGQKGKADLSSRSFFASWSPAFLQNTREWATTSFANPVDRAYPLFRPPATA